MSQELIQIGEIFLLQYFYQISRTVGTLHNVEGNMKETLFFTFIIQILWLFSTYLGIVSIMHGNWIAVCAYMIAGIIGSYQGIKIIQKRKIKVKNEN